jgi:hypothetical protein
MTGMTIPTDTGVSLALGSSMTTSTTSTQMTVRRGTRTGMRPNIPKRMITRLGTITIMAMGILTE